MFGLFRTIFWGIVLFGGLYVVKKKKAKKYQLILFVTCILVLWSVSGLLPVENIFITFSSPEKAYEYVNSEKIQLVVGGDHTTFVVGKESPRKYVYLIIPKSDSGWKIGRGLDTKLIKQKVVDEIVVRVYQYRNTDDYYVTVSDVRGNVVDINDNNDSIFHVLEEIKGGYYTYYAYVNKITDQYSITVNGEEVKLLE